MIIATSFETYMEETKGDVQKALQSAKEDGFEAIGIVMSESLNCYLEKIDILRNSGMLFCIHANMIDTNIASSNEGIRKESVRQFKEAMFLAKELDARIVTIHPGKFRNSIQVQEAYMLLDLSLSELIPFALQNNVVLCLENMEPWQRELCVSLTQVEKVLERHPNLGLTLDLAHVAMSVSSEEEIISYYLSLKNRITHFHISGIKQNISHVEVSLKDSDVDFTNMIRMIKDFSGIIRIENRERKKNIESLEFIRKVLE